MKSYFDNVIEFDASTRTAEDAAKQLKCDIGQIAKSIIFRGASTNTPYLFITSGRHRVDEAKAAELTGEPIAKADASFCKEKTGYVIGGIPPYHHREQIQTYIDHTLFSYDSIWAAAGTPTTVFQTTAEDLKEKAHAKIAEIA